MTVERPRRGYVVTHGVTRNVDEAVVRLRRIADEAGVTLQFDGETSLETLPDVTVVLGGDGTMLRALTRFLDTGVPVIGANFGRVGFLAAITADGLEDGMRRVFAGEYVVQPLPTLEIEVAGEKHTAVNDAVIMSATPGRIVDLEYAISGELQGVQACDGLICATPAGSTAYNLSNGGPVLVWGLDAAVITFVSPHTLHARPLVVPPDFTLTLANRSPRVDAVVLADGHQVAALSPDDGVTVRFGASRTLLGTLPEQSFFGRYREVFGPR